MTAVAFVTIVFVQHVNVPRADWEIPFVTSVVNTEACNSRLDRLAMLIIIAHEAGETYLADVRKEFAGQAQSEEVVLLEALVPPHCRACRTAREICAC